MSVIAKLDFHAADTAEKIEGMLSASDHGEIELVDRTGSVLTVKADREMLTGWVNCLKMRRMIPGLVAANLHAAITQSTPA